ncbi:hypothetical protein NHX12_009853 [Muraenolepis orangiensis]|uniref:UDENN FNIP1/2-type domain-containing protein n=1 Tax=Muraenolepis orangiensis TaxID=630683 RepID=A0A9Q0I8R8_9TELE|nr:hypothetical protein NHX12_009853 [Muraenolepis orangiensis]
MAPTLFQKLFNKRNALSPPSRPSKDGPAFSWPVTQLEPSQIRLIVYQECERRGRNVLFDSSTKKRTAEDTPITRMCSEGQAKMFEKCCQLHPTGGSSSSLDSSSSSGASESRDGKEQGLRFQVTASAYVELQDSLEFIGQDPNNLRPDPNNSLLGNIGLSQLCGPRRAYSEQGPLRLIKSASFFSGHSNPMDMPGRGMYDERDSGIARSASLSSLLITPFPSPGSSLNSSCASSYQRRWSVDESFNMSDDSGGPGLGVARKKKIAIGVIFLLSPDPEENSRFQDFFFSHFPLFESHMNKLKSAIEQAMRMSRRSADVSQRALAYSRMVDGLNDFRSVTPEKQLLCSHFMRELALLVEQASKNQFLPALLTAILTNHLAWVPTVMPNGQPPIKIFLEKHSSQSVDMLAKTHPYNPLWAQLGDLYGAIGSPVRLSRTVVVGRRQELVQRLLYVLTYFIRCSELLESHLLDGVEDEAIVMPGSLITTSLRRGEVEESDYVLITVHKPSGNYLGQGPPGAAGSTDTGAEPCTRVTTEDELHRESNSPRNAEAVCVGSTSPGENLIAAEHSSPSAPIFLTAPGPLGPGETEVPGDTVSPGPQASEIPSEKKPPDKSASPELGVPSATGPMTLQLMGEEEEQPANKVTFLIGDSMSPESDTESRRRKVEEEFKNSSVIPEDQVQPTRARTCALLRVSSKMPQWGGDADTADNSRSNRPVETRTIDHMVSPPAGGSTMDRTHKELLDPSGAPQGPGAAPVGSGSEEGSTAGDGRGRCRCGPAGGHCCCGAGSAVQDRGIVVSVTAPQDAGDLTKGDQKEAEAVLGDWEIPRNESLDSALGDSESEDTEDWQEEVPVPFPGAKQVENYSKPSIANYGRSLFGGYCPTYVPDFVLHGIPGDEALRQGLMAELNHAVQHPVLDEPIAEAVCIIADTDRWTVQVASSQRRATDVNKLGKEVLVSALVSGLLQSTYQLYKLNISPNFCVMHLEDRLQEIYFKSKMLAEYLKGQTRVHVKELGMVLGIESSDLPLLAAVASTHSPYVAQILL